jgi:hypothetical protein
MTCFLPTPKVNGSPLLTELSKTLLSWHHSQHSQNSAQQSLSSINYLCCKERQTRSHCAYLEAAYVVNYCFAVQWYELAIARPYDVFNELVCAIAEIDFLALQACMIAVTTSV